MIPKKYRTLISNTGIEKIYFLFLSSTIVVFFEMVGIGSVPVFAYIVIDPDVFLETLSEKFNIYCIIIRIYVLCHFCVKKVS